MTLLTFFFYFFVACHHQQQGEQSTTSAVCDPIHIPLPTLATLADEPLELFVSCWGTTTPMWVSISDDENVSFQHTKSIHISSENTNTLCSLQHRSVQGCARAIVLAPKQALSVVITLFSFSSFHRIFFISITIFLLLFALLLPSTMAHWGFIELKKFFSYIFCSFFWEGRKRFFTRKT